MAKPTEPFLLRAALRDGTPVLVRPLRPDEGDKLVEGMQKLSSESRRRRFLSVKSRLSRKEVDFLTRCDMRNHLAIGLAITDEQGREVLAVAVARCVRATDDPTLGDVAVVVLDEWQQRGIGTLLTERLAALCSICAIRVCAYGVLGNHFHLVLYIDSTRARSWSDEGVVARHGWLVRHSAAQWEKLPATNC